MLLSRLVAFPESNRILRIHLFSAPFISIHLGLLAMIPVLLRKPDGFAGAKWQVIVATTAMPVAALFSILWSEVYRRISPAWYVFLIWLLAFLPLGGVALSRSAGMVLVFVVVASFGLAGLNPLNGDVLRSCYPPAVRGKVFSILQTVTQCTVMLITFGVGYWLDRDGQAFRLYMPLGVVLMGLGAISFARITRQPLFQERAHHSSSEPLIASLRHAYRGMYRSLREDPDFRRYETGYFIYGMGWMACHALLPFLLVDVLRLEYGQVATATQVTFYLVQLLMLVPAGFLIDRVGHVRMAGWAFAIMAFYPLILIFCTNIYTLTAAIVVYGLGITGVNLTWTIGPVSMARDAARASHYLAIHASMVGLRAGLGQIPAVVLYWLTGDIRIPLLIAALLFMTGAWIMFRLERDQKIALAVAVPEEMPPAHTEVP